MQDIGGQTKVLWVPRPHFTESPENNYSISEYCVNFVSPSKMVKMKHTFDVLVYLVPT